jgi:hypothetical protein
VQTEGLTSQKVVKQVRDRKIDRGKGQARSLAEVRAFLEALTGPTEAAPVKQFVEDFLKFIQSKVKDDTMQQRLRKLLGTCPSEAGQAAFDGPEQPAA